MKILILGGTGYIGSLLTNYFISKGYHISTVDLEWFGSYNNVPNLRMDYGDLQVGFLKGFDVIVLLAGHSSVPMCIGNNLSTFNNNVRNFIELLTKLDPRQKFIYASSASVYGKTTDYKAEEGFLAFEPINAYDISKWEIDLWAKISGLNYYGLRFGTVCGGGSNNTRIDIMINQMVVTALSENIIKVNNPWVNRPILGTRDLARAIEAIVLSKKDIPGIYNLASFNTTVDQISKAVAKEIGVKIKYLPDSLGYDMSISTDKFQQVFNFDFLDTPKSIVNDLLTTLKTTHTGVRKEKVEYDV